MELRSCEKDGMRLTIDPEGRWGSSDARAIGRKVARNEREGAADRAAMADSVRETRGFVGGWYGSIAIPDGSRSLPASSQASASRQGRHLAEGSLPCRGRRAGGGGMPS